MYSIPLSVPSINGNEWKYVKECLDTEWVSSAGKYVDLFEQKIAEYTGANYAIACVNGTSALQVSLRLAGVKPGDEVIIPSLTFIAPVNAIAYIGADPLFMDSDKYYNIDVEKTILFIENETIIQDGLTYNKVTNNRISAIVPVHVWGNAAWLDELVSLCKKRNIAIVEDASESLGTFYTTGIYKGMHTGTIGEIGCLSFNGNKIITTGGGGMILTDEKKLADKAKYLTTQAKDDPIRYIHDEIGYNFRLTNIQSALGVAQLENLSTYLYQKEKNHLFYKEHINNIDGLKLVPVPKYADNNHWLNIIQIDRKIYGMNRDSLMDKLEQEGLQARPVWRLNHLQKPYNNFETYNIENALMLVENSLCIPSGPQLTDTELERVVTCLNNREQR